MKRIFLICNQIHIFQVFPKLTLNFKISKNKETEQGGYTLRFALTINSENASNQYAFSNYSLAYYMAYRFLETGLRNLQRKNL